jgi:uncharacterized delta-60 repeat protein
MMWLRRTLHNKAPRTRCRRPQLCVELLESRTLLSGDPSLTLSLASHSIAENAGPAATTGTVTRVNMDTSQALMVQLKSSNTSQATVPTSVTIPAGATSTTFNVDAVDDYIVNPPQLVTITGWTASPLPPGLDTTFGSGGLASVTLYYSSSANFPGMVLQPDGKIVAVAASQTSGATWSVTRTLPNGTPDTSFGSGGTVATTFTGATGGYANGVALQPDGKIVVVGTVNGVSSYDAWGIARYNSDGSLDTGFGNHGLLLIKFTGEAGWLYDAAVLADGHILVSGMLQQPAGFAVARLTSSGQIDTTFGTNGYASINPDPGGPWTNTTGQAMIVQADGKILMTGIADFNYLAVSRFNANGSVDTAFGSSGTARIPLSTLGTGFLSVSGNDLAVQGDGKIVVVGQAAHNSSSNNDFVVARLNPSGTLDTGFNGTGVATLDFAGGNDEAQDVAIQADGKIVLGGGAVVPGTGFFLALARFNADGTLDSTFGNNGTLLTRPPGVFERIWSMGLQPDGKLVTLAGYTSTMQVIRYDTGLLTASDQLTVTDTDSGPVANAGGPYTVPEGASVVLDASGTTDANQDPSTLTYLWDLNGDGVYGETGSAATHGDEVGIHPTYLVNGIDGPTSVVAYLEVIDNQNRTSFATANIQITEVNPAIYPGGDTNMNEGGTLSRTGSFTDPGPDTWSATVDYGDGSGTQPLNLNADKTFNLSHTYGDEGKFKVSVTIWDDHGNGTLAYFYVTVTDITPQVQPGGNTTIHDGGIYTSAGSFTDAGPDTWTATVDYGDGSGAQPLTLNSDKSFNLSHRYTEEGTYTVIVTVTDDDGTAGTGTLSVTVDDPIPVVNAGSDTTIHEGGSYAGSGSFSDASADTWTATVDYGDGSGNQPLTLLANQTFSLNHTYADEGSYSVTVTVTDDDGTAGIGTFVVTVDNPAPVVTAGGDTVIYDGDSLYRGGSFSDPGADTWTATVDYGDGAGAQPLTLNANKTFTLNHAYTEEGTYTVTVVVADDDGVSGTATFHVTVNDPVPSVTLGSDLTLNEGDAFSESAYFRDSSPDTWTATVDYGEGAGPQPLSLNSDQSFGLYHIYKEEGSYTVTVVVTDDDGTSGTASFNVTVKDVTPTITAGGNLTLNEGDGFGRNGYFSDPSGDTWTGTVNYGDGSGNQSLTLNADKTFNIGHVYRDEGSYTVTVTVTDDEGVSGTGTFTVTANNVVPTVSAGGNTTINEGDTLSRAGSFTDPGADTWTGTVNYGDGSGKQSLTLNANKTFSLNHTYTDNGSFTVLVTVTDDDGASGSASFTVTANNVAPTASLGNNGPVGENSPVTVSFTNPFDPSSADTQAGFHYSFALSAAQLAGSYAAATDGASKAFIFPDGPAAPVVFGRIFDKDNGYTTYQTTVTVNNVPPTAAVTGPTASVRGQPVPYTFTAQDPSPNDQAAGFTYAIAWGDGTSTNANGPGSISASHVYTASGSYTIQVWATDKDGGKSAQPGTLGEAVSAAALENGDLYVGGTTSSDTIIIKPNDPTGTVLAVTINGAAVGTYQPTGQLVVYGQAGTDSIQLQTGRVGRSNVPITVPSILFAGSGNTTLSAAGSSAANVLVGGAGNDSLQGGSGRDILIGGAGSDTLQGGSGGDILIPATTDYDANIAALAALRKEWARTDLSYNDRINHLYGTTSGGYNGTNYLTPSTVHDDVAIDYLYGGGGGDWYFAMTTGSTADFLSGRKKNEVLTALG